LQVDVARNNIDVRIDDGDERLGHICVAQANGLEKSPVGRTFDALLDL
jgi:hypothetical protein